MPNALENLIKLDSWQSETYSSSDETLEKHTQNDSPMALTLRSCFSFHPIPNRPQAPSNDFHTGAFWVLSNSENIGNGSAFSLSSGGGGRAEWNTPFQPISFNSAACAKAGSSSPLKGLVSQLSSGGAHICTTDIMVCPLWRVISIYILNPEKLKSKC